MRLSFGKIVLGVVAMALLSVGDAEAQRGKRKKKDNRYGTHAPKELEASGLDAEYYFSEGQKFYILEDFGKAEDFFERSLEIEPNNAAAKYRLAQIAASKGEMVRAERLAKETIRLDSLNKYYYVTLANIYAKEEKPDLSALVYERLVNTVPGTDEYYYELAAIRTYQQKWDKALEAYAKIEEVYGPSEGVTRQIQKLYLRKNDLDGAIEAGKRLIERNPSSEGAVLNVVGILMANGKNKEALPYLESLLKQVPDSPKAALMLADIESREGNFDSADSLIRSSLNSERMSAQDKVNFLAQKMPLWASSDSGKEQASSYLTLLLEKHPDEASTWGLAGDWENSVGDKDKALKNYTEALEWDKNNFPVWQNVVSLQLEKNQLDNAIESSEEALTYFPNQAIMYYFNGTAYLIKKSYKRAASAFKQGIKLSEGNKALSAVLWGQLGDAYNGTEEHEKSDNAYDEALKLDPESEHVLNNYSYFLSLRKKNLEKALKMSGQLVERFPDNVTYLDTHAWVLYQMKDYDKALVLLKKAVEKEPSGVIVEHYGDALYRKGRIDEARKQWKKAKELGDTSDLLDKKIADGKIYE
ncbi:hypothetical protein FUAX_03820 [Fulvitalea axinellae]|uniref:Tetratricopeptide repeat protein n=1 Tax=Fulvitalea axinellae TaxID=1182444 RepID=A0AAU9D705_9BACT|nr:hypothetical protein FUAX_03820 [Fulvitalea axinellae]